ncbi:MAG: N-acetyltransferase [Candidatus Poseidoniales archaeon]|nr:MAG: N-acetyltransferase [Candidatus Poseidoniales archaeon]
MSLTPVLEIDDGLSLIPVNKSILSSVLEAYNEDPESALVALPWLNNHEDIRTQLRDMLFDVESQSDKDELHFWSIITGPKKEFVGLIGLGDELQLLHSNYNLGYWVRTGFRRQNIAIRCVNEILSWLKSRDEFFRIEITVHPHNEAGLATAQSICKKWQGELVEEFIGIEIGNRTVPHRIHIIDIKKE